MASRAQAGQANVSATGGASRLCRRCRGARRSPIVRAGAADSWALTGEFCTVCGLPVREAALQPHQFLGAGI